MLEELWLWWTGQYNKPTFVTKIMTMIEKPIEQTHLCKKNYGHDGQANITDPPL